MMGKGHAISGAATWLAVTTSTPGALGLLSLGPGPTLTGALVSAGAALLPDADHHNATIAHSVPIIGKASATAISGMAGGHRHGTHSLLAMFTFPIAVWYMQFLVISPTWWHSPIPVLTLLATIAVCCFAVKAMGVVKSWPKAWLFGVGVGAIVFLTPSQDIAWISYALAIGFATHLLGDFLTIGGLPLLWPWNPRPPKALRHTPVRYFWMPNGYFAFPILGKTGSIRESILTVVLLMYVVWLLFGFLRELVLSLI